MMNYKKHGSTGLFFAALAHAIDPNLDLELLARVAFCDLCAKGHQPENGVHVIMGASIPCEAFQQCLHTDAGDSAASSNISQASAESASENESTPPQRG